MSNSILCPVCVTGEREETTEVCNMCNGTGILVDPTPDPKTEFKITFESKWYEPLKD
jgi:hypothetical protein